MELDQIMKYIVKSLQEHSDISLVEIEGDEILCTDDEGNHYAVKVEEF
jgi:hypothetical protein